MRGAFFGTGLVLKHLCYVLDRLQDQRDCLFLHQSLLVLILHLFHENLAKGAYLRLKLVADLIE